MTGAASTLLREIFFEYRLRLLVRFVAMYLVVMYRRVSYEAPHGDTANGSNRYGKTLH